MSALSTGPVITSAHNKMGGTDGVLGVSTQNRDHGRAFPVIWPCLRPALIQGHGLVDAPKMHLQPGVCTHTTEMWSRPSCVPAGSWSSTGCLQGCRLESGACKASLQNGIQMTSVWCLPLFILFFSEDAAKFCSTAQQLVCLHPRAFGQEVLFTASSFLCLKIPVRRQHWKFMQISHFEALKFYVTKYIRVK